MPTDPLTFVVCVIIIFSCRCCCLFLDQASGLSLIYFFSKRLGRVWNDFQRQLFRFRSDDEAVGRTDDGGFLPYALSCLWFSAVYSSCSYCLLGQLGLQSRVAREKK